MSTNTDHRFAPPPPPPASRPGFAAGLMLKDLRRAQAAALSAGPSTPLGAVAAAAFAIHDANGHSHLDTSSIIKLIKPDIE